MSPLLLPWCSYMLREQIKYFPLALSGALEDLRAIRPIMQRNLGIMFPWLLRIWIKIKKDGLYT